MVYFVCVYETFFFFFLRKSSDSVYACLCEPCTSIVLVTTYVAESVRAGQSWCFIYEKGGKNRNHSIKKKETTIA